MLREVVVGKAVAADEFGAEVSETALGAHRAAAGVEEEDRGLVAPGHLGGQGGLAQAGLGHDAQVAAGMARQERLQPIPKDELPAHKAAGVLGDVL